eukprot:m.13136 g.13136  ORF g.13136 m.13136 type:complete len:244 (+) comp4462_c0_seq2:143-874(+)
MADSGQGSKARQLPGGAVKQDEFEKMVGAPARGDARTQGWMKSLHDKLDRLDIATARLPQRAASLDLPEGGSSFRPRAMSAPATMRNRRKPLTAIVEATEEEEEEAAREAEEQSKVKPVPSGITVTVSDQAESPRGSFLAGTPARSSGGGLSPLGGGETRERSRSLGCAGMRRNPASSIAASAPSPPVSSLVPTSVVQQQLKRPTASAASSSGSSASPAAQSRRQQQSPSRLANKLSVTPTAV